VPSFVCSRLLINFTNELFFLSINAVRIKLQGPRCLWKIWFLLIIQESSYGNIVKDAKTGKRYPEVRDTVGEKW